MLFENSKNLTLKADFENLSSNLTNPFTDIKMWLKYEVLEIDAMTEAILKRGEL